MEKKDKKSGKNGRGLNTVGKRILVLTIAILMTFQFCTPTFYGISFADEEEYLETEQPVDEQAVEPAETPDEEVQAEEPQGEAADSVLDEAVTEEPVDEVPADTADEQEEPAAPEEVEPAEPAAEEPAVEPADEEPQDEPAQDEQPADEEPADAQPEDVQPAEEQPAEEPVQDEEQTEEVKYPAQNFDDTTSVKDVEVHVVAPEGALPEGTTMTVKNVGFFEMRGVKNAVAEEMGSEAKVIKAVDITFFDKDGKEVQPKEGFPVSVSMNSSKFADLENPTVVHVDDNKKAEVVAENVTGDTAEEVVFDAEHFSVYVVVEGVDPDARLMVNFYDKDGTTLIKAMSITQAQLDEINTHIYDPGVPSLGEGEVFKGWTEKSNYTPADAESAVDIEGVRSKVRGILNEAVQDGTEVNYYAAIYKSHHIAYIDELGVTVHTDEVLYKEGGTDPVPYTVSFAYTPYFAAGSDEDDPDKAANFDGWKLGGSDTIYQNDDVIANLTGDITLEAQVAYGHYLVFNENGSGASYTAPLFVEDNETIAAAGIAAYEVGGEKAPKRTGYVFGGWYTDSECTTALDTSQTITAVLNVYAKWTEVQTTSFTVLVWKESLSGGYDFDRSITVDEAQTGTNMADFISGNIGDSTIEVNNEDVFIPLLTVPTSDSDYGKECAGFMFKEYDSNNDGKVASNGTSVLNVYFERRTYTLKFYYGRTITSGGINNYETVATTSNNGTPTWRSGYSYDSSQTYYGYRNNQYITLTYRNGRFYRSNTNTYNSNYVYIISSTSGGTERWQVAHNGDYSWQNASNGFTPGYIGDSLPTDSDTVGDGQGGTFYYAYITAKYGENIADKWPAYGDFNDRRISGSGADTSEYLNSWIMMPGAKGITGSGGGRTVKGKLTTMDEQIIGDLSNPNAYLIAQYNNQPNEYKYFIYYKAQDGETYESTRTYNGTTYYLVDTIDVYSGSGYGDQHYPKYKGYDFVGQQDNQPHSSSTGREIYFFYDPAKYPLLFMDGLYEDGSHNPIKNLKDNTILALSLTDDEDKRIPFGDDISEYNDFHPYDKIVDGDRYVFLGWYTEETCQEANKYTFDKMPEDGITVYAKWVLKEYHIELHPNTDGDNSFTYINGQPAGQYGTYGDEFWADNGGKVGTVGGTRDQYTLIGWFSNENLSRVWDFDAFTLNDTTVGRHGTIYDPEDPTSEYNPAYPGTVGKLDLYASWRRILSGAAGINVIYTAVGKDDDGNTVTGSGAPTDNNQYADQANAIARPAATAPAGSNLSFECWVVQRWNSTANEWEDTDQVVYPSDRFLVKYDDAKEESIENPTDPSITTKYTVQLRAQYSKPEEPTHTHIYWYNNYTDSEAGIVKRNEDVTVNSTITIPGEQTRTGYTFLGWARESEVDNDNNRIYTYSGLTEDDLFLTYIREGENAGKYSYVNTNGATKIAAGVFADENRPYDGLYAFWEANDVEYNVKYYYMNDDGTYPETATSVADPVRTAKTDSEVSVTAEDKIPNDASKYALDESKSEAWTATVAGDGSTVLKVYFRLNKANYTVEHYQQNVDGNGYTLVTADTQTITDTVGKEVTATPKTYTGFTFNENAADTVKTGTVTADGQLVLKLYYDRNAYDVLYKITGTYFATEQYKLIEDVPYETPLSQITDDMTKAGYVWSGWTGLPATMPAADVTVTGSYTARTDTQYTVRHWQQNLEDNEYTEVTADRETKTGTTGTLTNAEAKTYTGFTPQPVGQRIIAGDGSTIVDIYYDRDTYTVTYQPGEHGTFQTQTTEGVKYGAATPAAPATPGEAGYTFTGWSPAVESTVTANITYVAQWSANTDTKYTVEYYYQANGTYAQTADSSVERTGTTDTTASVTDTDKTPTKTGYVFDSAAGNVLTGTIAGDGSLVLKVYFKQQFTVTYEPGAHGTFETQTTGSLDYGTATPAAPEATGDAGYTFTGWTPAVAETVTADATYVAQWSADDDTKYTVEYYYMDASTGTYPATATNSVERSGETDTTASVTDADKTSADATYVFDSAAGNVLSGTIAGDGSLTLKVYFKKQFTVVYEPGAHGTFDTQTTGSLDYGTATPAAPEATGDAGYTFTGWDPEVAATVKADATYVAQWSANTNTEYTVRHWQQNIENDEYTEVVADRETKTGTTDTLTAAVAKTYTGFTAKAFEQKNIAGDGSTVVDIYYDRTTHTITYEPGTKGTFDPQVTEGVKYGAATPEAPEATGLPGYTFTGWAPEVAETVTGDATYVAQWSANTDTQYTVRHWQQNLENDEYTEVVADRETKTGTTDTLTQAAAKTYTGFTAKAFEQKNIAGDGSTVVDIYYDRNTYTVIYQPGAHGTFQTQTNEGVKYGADTPAAPEATGEENYTFTGWSPAVAETVTADATYTAQWNANVEVIVEGTSIEKEYNGKPQTNDGYTVTYKVAGETVTSLPEGITAKVELKAAEGTNVGDYTGSVTVTIALDEGTTGYTITVPTATDEIGLKITPKPVTITADDKTKVYGNDDPELTATVEGAVEGETLDYTVTREEGETVKVGEDGTISGYTITVTPTEGKNGNYQITTETGTFTINKRHVILTSEDASQPYNGKELRKEVVKVGGDGFAAKFGDYAEYKDFSSRILVGSSPNYFDYEIKQDATANKGMFTKILRALGILGEAYGEEAPEHVKNELENNYDIERVYGTLTVTDKKVDPDDVLTKTHEDKTFKVGETITFTIEVTNIYDEVKTITLTEIEGVTLEQSVFEDVEPGAVVTTTATYTATEEDALAGTFKNTVKAEYSGEDEPFTNDDEVKDFAHMTVEKKVTNTPADGKAFKTGETIKYEITVKNDGTAELKDIVVKDELTGDEWKIDSLAAGKSKTFKAEYLVTEKDGAAGSVTNVATAEGTDPDGDKTPGTPGEVKTTTDKADEPVVPKTGDTTPIVEFSVIFVASIITLLMMLFRRKKERA